MEATGAIVHRITAAGGIFNGIWETPAGTFVVMTEPASMSTTLVSMVDLSDAGIQARLAAVRQRFGLVA